MRIDLPAVLNPGNTVVFSIDWSYNIYDRMQIGGRGGYEYFPKDGNYAYTLAQWYPRMAVYSDFEGWQNKQFLGRGEFALTFGDFEVNITVPSDHIVNSDERQWTWMDEGLNTFLEHQTLAERYPDFNTTWGTPKSVTRYMKGDKSRIRPIMTNSEQILQFGYNAYGKPSAVLVILRETVMGPALFDKAFKTYAQRWAFKHPEPADFFRTMEDASAVDLDWFWRGWFYSTDHVDLTVENVKWYKIRDTEMALEGRHQ